MMVDHATQRSIFSLKSWLFTPGTKANRFQRAAEAGADALIIDLEDSVAPPSKGEARAAAINYLGAAPEPALAYALRINALNTKAGLEDLQALLGSAAAPDYLVLPKCDSPGFVSLVDALLKEAGKSTRIIVLVETVKGLATLEEMASHPPIPAAFLFGAADMAAGLGAKAEWEPLLMSRSHIVAAAALAGIAALDSPYFDLSNEPGLRLETTRCAALGFHGKCAIHPEQIATINEVFTPSEEELTWARRVIAGSRQGAARVDDQMVDEAIARRARVLLARAGVPA
jgi:(S)-citramalyl-CoA lyase